MKTILIPAGESNALTLAMELFHQGGLVAFPTDTVYGLGALAYNGIAIQKIYTAKGRGMEKAIPVLIGDAEDLVKVALKVPRMALMLAERFWPGPLTLVVPKHPHLPDSISPNATVGVRIPNHPLARALLQKVGPLAVTSANRSGQPGVVTALEVFAMLKGRIPLVLDGGRTTGGIPSTVVDCCGTEPRILRIGPISAEEIHSACRQMD